MFEETYNIRELDLDLLQPNAQTFMKETQGGGKYVVIGKPGTGKSFLISDLIYHKSHLFPIAMVQNGTEDSNHMYSRFMPELFIYDALNLTKLEDFVKRQKVAREYLPNPWAMLVIDDCFDNPKLFKTTVMNSLFKNGRQYKMFMIMGMQYCLDVPPAIRVCIDGTFIFAENSRVTRKKIWENFASVIPDFGTFCAIMDQITTDNTALYVHNSGTNNSFEKSVFWYKAKPVPKNFKFGSPEFWKYQHKRLTAAKP